jgi:hypothetical protein
MRCDDHDIVALCPMHNPQHAAAVFGDRLIRSLALRVSRIGFDKIG